MLGKRFSGLLSVAVGDQVTSLSICGMGATRLGFAKEAATVANGTIQLLENNLPPFHSFRSKFDQSFLFLYSCPYYCTANNNNGVNKSICKFVEHH